MAKKALGRGLEALFTEEAEDKNLIKELRIIEVEPDKSQPRKTFDEKSLNDLSESIKEHGIIQPIIVKKANNGFYKIIAGERRWRAAKKAGLKVIPSIIKEYADKEVLEVALIENLQREDLNPIEEAEAYKRLMEEFSLTQEEISVRVGKSRSAIANSLRLLNLCDDVRQLLTEGKLSAGHARALLSIEGDDIRKKVAERIVNEDMNVRETEKHIKGIQNNSVPQDIAKPKKTKMIDEQYRNLENVLSEKLGTKVKIYYGKRKGKIEIEYYSNQELEDMVKRITRG
jgi:ParB family chromosome partitioning protein